MQGGRQRHRTAPAVRAGRSRAASLSHRLGVGLREARRSAGLTQHELAARSEISQARVSEIERGEGWATSLETWACLAAAVGEQLVVFLEHAPGAGRPRDIEHLRRQSAVVEIARAGGWSALPELAIDPASPKSRSIDVALVRRATREAVVVEIWDWFDDVGAGLRGLDAKIGVLATRLAAQPAGRDRWRVRGLYVVRGTRRNRRLVHELRPLFAARFPGSALAWLGALTDPARAMPAADGLLWSDARGALTASRLNRG
jgi:transcriptional regulator with XRE-family HTH domain